MGALCGLPGMPEALAAADRRVMKVDGCMLMVMKVIAQKCMQDLANVVLLKRLLSAVDEDRNE